MERATCAGGRGGRRSSGVLPAHAPGRRRCGRGLSDAVDMGIESATLIEQRLAPQATKGHVAVSRPVLWWYGACRSADLLRRPLARTLLGMPLVLFRDDGGRPAALLDRCPHRNVPLSLGRVLSSGRLECAYHGWQLDGSGRCRTVPGLCDEGEAAGRRAPAFAAQDRDGFVWVFATPDVEPVGEPLSLPFRAAPGY